MGLTLSRQAMHLLESYPPEYLLQEWENRLTQEPDCAPDCVAFNSVFITIADETLQMRMRIGAGTELGVALQYDKSCKPSVY